MPGYVYGGDNAPESGRGRGRPKNPPSEVCGTYEGYMRHFRRKDKRCEPCKKARREYRANATQIVPKSLGNKEQNCEN